MRKKLWFGVLAVTILSVAAGAHLFSRTNAQDPPKKAEGEKKADDWFDTLKKALEAKKDNAPLPAPSAIAAPQTPVAPPALPPLKDDKSVIPPPSGLPAFSPQGSPEKKTGAQDSVPPVIFNGPLSYPKNEDGGKQTKPPSNSEKPASGLPPIVGDPGPIAPLPAKPETSAPPVAPPSSIQDVKPPTDIPPIGPIPKDPPKPNLPSAKPSTPPTVQIAPNPPIGEQVARMKDCPWSLHVEIVNGMTHMTCTVNKKHEFKIVCKSVDLQTGKNTLKATGKVQITGDMMTGSCDQLSIPLMEDRLVMEGASLVSIQKVATSVSSEKAASFELKGSSLELRISDIVPAKLVQATSWQRIDEAGETTRTTGTVPQMADAKKWTPYGRLMPAKMDLGGNEMAWSLVGNDGKVITYLVARNGGTLSQYEGQRISVLGANEQIAGRTMLRVTHIALP